MKKLLVISSLVLLAVTSNAMARSSYSNTRGGYYAHGSGSSHKGGSYRNAASGNHYQKRH